MASRNSRAASAVDEDALAIEVDPNFDYFQRNLASLLKDNAGEYARLRCRHVIDFFGTVGEAYRSAAEKIPRQAPRWKASHVRRAAIIGNAISRSIGKAGALVAFG